jgi:hypothetical protein
MLIKQHYRWHKHKNIPAGAIATVATLAYVGHTRTELKKNYSQMNIDHNWQTT